MDTIINQLWLFKVGILIAKYLVITHRYQPAVALFQECLQLAGSLPLPLAVKKVLYGELLQVHMKMGQVDKARTCHEVLMQIKKDVGEKVTESDECYSLALLYFRCNRYGDSVEYLERAIAKRSGNCEIEIFRIYHQLGCAYMALANYTSAVKSLEKSLEIARMSKNKSWELETCFELGQALYGLSELKKAKDYLERHLSLAEEFGDRRQKSLAYLNLGNYYHDVGKYGEAIKCHTHQLEIAIDIKDKHLQRHAYGVLGREYSQTGKAEEALENLEQSLRMAKEEGDKKAEGEAYGNIGNAYKLKGEYGKALECFEKSRDIASRLHDKETEANAHSNLGSTHRLLGNYNEAIIHHQRNLKMKEDMGNKAAGQAKAYHDLGNVSLDKGESDEAIKHFQKSLEMLKKSGHEGDAVHAYGNLCAVYFSNDTSEEALKCTQEYLQYCQTMGHKDGEKTAVVILGKIFLSRRNFEEAVACHERFLELSKETGAKDGQANAYTYLGLDHEMQGDSEGAKKYYLFAIQLREEIQHHIGNRDDCKVSIGELQHRDYRSLSRVLINNMEHEEALVAVERGRARALTDLMMSSYRIQPSRVERKPLDASEIKTSIKRSGATTIVISEVNDHFLYLWIAEPNGGISLQSGSEQTPHGFESTINSLYQDVLGEHVRCEDRSLAVLYDGKEQQTTKIKAQSSSVEALHFDVMESVRNTFVAMKLTHLRGPYSSDVAHNSQCLRRLYNLVIAPAVDLLRSPEILVVPDGSFHLVPLAALMDERGRVLSETFRIRVLPSLTTMRLILNSPPEYHSQSGALIVGDPNVGEVDFRGNIKMLGRLEFASKEVEMIGDLLHVTPLTGGQATKEEVLQQMTSVALIHIAAHGNMETGEIALAPNPNRGSLIPKEQDFLLSIADVHRARMRAQLVVLSCCHSGCGKIKAEGVVGIARAFLGAGARSVLVSLWAIDDKATMMFMRSFYEHLHGGESASEALHQAMKCLRESQQFGDVKYWAPFVLIGDDVKLAFN